MIVADANLIAAFCINSTGTPAAKAVFAKDRAWIAPKLWQAEFVSVLLKHRRAQILTSAETARSLHLAESLMSGMDYDNDLSDVLAVADRAKCSSYDSCYLSLAALQRVKLVTSDAGLVANAPSVAVTPEQFLSA